MTAAALGSSRAIGLCSRAGMSDEADQLQQSRQVPGLGRSNRGRLLFLGRVLRGPPLGRRFRCPRRHDLEYSAPPQINRVVDESGRLLELVTAIVNGPRAGPPLAADDADLRAGGDRHLDPMHRALWNGDR